MLYIIYISIQLEKNKAEQQKNDEENRITKPGNNKH